MNEESTHPASQPEGQEMPADYSYALAWVGSDRSLLEEVVRIFLQDCPERLKELRAAVSAGDAERIQRVAHGLKGALAGFGARQARDLAEQLEMMGESGTTANAPEVLPALEQELDRVLACLATAEWRW